jgi:hypothetical protein
LADTLIDPHMDRAAAETFLKALLNSALAVDAMMPLAFAT